ncbi:hypothetical protein Fcan01_16037 [Folsomia candida]|uniref:Uncharacterized protein n=1 Tax=Folsomia candida TaxID=158441 RepID=A0A226DVL6_FOLCA|nr:hypothetical protein Fcan01_16037 [Folsomia candida]
MYHDKALKHMHRAIHAIQRSTFRKAYCFHWDSKKRRAIALQNGKKYRNFQILCNIFIFLLTPVFIARSCHLATTIRQETPTSIAVTFTVSAAVTGFIPLAWFLRRPSGPRKYVFVYDATWLENPAYTAIRAVRNFERRGKLCSVIVLLPSGILSTLGGLFFLATLGACILVSGYGVVCLYIWTVAMTPRFRVRTGLPFKTAVHMHNCHVTMLHSEVAHDMVVICLHHAAMVLTSTIALYNIITELAKGEGMSLMLIWMGVALISVSVVIEIFAIYFNGMASTWSKRFLEKMRLAHGGNKYKRKVLQCFAAKLYRLGNPDAQNKRNKCPIAEIIQGWMGVDLMGVGVDLGGGGFINADKIHRQFWIQTTKEFRLH